MALRDYQVVAVNEAEERLLDGSPRLLMVSAVGTGKTEMFVELIRRFQGLGRCMVIAERRELIQQAATRIAANAGIYPEIEMGSSYANEGAWGRCPIIVSTVQTLISGRGDNRRMTRFNPHEFALIIVDEAHHAVATSYRAVLKHFDVPECRILGVTATPDRLDEKALGQVYPDAITAISVLDAISLGWLVDVKQIPATIDGLDFSACRSTAGDLNGRDLDLVMNAESPMLGICKTTIEVAGDRPTILFTASVKAAATCAEIINRYNRNASAVWVCGKTPKQDREERIKGYREGRHQYLVNVGITIEGFDAPPTACIAMGRPTLSRSKYEQMLGRGMRTLGGISDAYEDPIERVKAVLASAKPNLLVIDFVGNSGRHKLVNAYDILGGDWDDEVPELAMRDAIAEHPDITVREAIEQAAKKANDLREAQAAAEAERRKHITPTVRYTIGKAVNPFDVFDVNPWRVKPWEKGRMASEAQVAMMTKCKVDNPEKLTMSAARQIITEIIDRRKQGLCTYAQARQLRKRGLPGKVPFETASEWITAIANTHWRFVPESVKAEARQYGDRPSATTTPPTSPSPSTLEECPF